MAGAGQVAAARVRIRGWQSSGRGVGAVVEAQSGRDEADDVVCRGTLAG